MPDHRALTILGNESDNDEAVSGVLFSVLVLFPLGGQSC